MSSKENSCRKFQANIFNKSKCQNCFKPRESHLLNDEDLNQAKPIYGGWLLLAPEGTDFDNPLHRSRKWQRRFFILYEHGLLRYALDEMPSTLPQGTINMNQCSDVIDGEARTGQKNSLVILTPDREHFIRAESKEIINGWHETLMVYPRTNKQNQKKKRKVETPTPQEGINCIQQHSSENMNGHLEPGPAKVTVTSSISGGGGNIPCLPSSIASVERVPASRASLWQEDRRVRAHIPCSRSASCISQLGQTGDQSSVNGGRKTRVESGYFSLEKTKPDPEPPQPPQQLLLSSAGSLRYSSSETDAPVSPYTPSPESGSGDPFPSPGPLFSDGSSTISSSQSSLESEASSTTPTSPARWVGRGGGDERLGRSASLAEVPKARRPSHRETLEQRARTRSPGREEVARLFGQRRRRSQVIEKFETTEGDNVEQMETSSSSEPPSSSSTSSAAQRQGRTERRYLHKKQELSLDSAKEQSMPDVSSSSNSTYRRAKSLDRRATESSMTPDLLNFKKGWMTKLYEDGLWKKHWFVLTDQSLRYYRDSVAEEAADLDGEIDLSTCYDVPEFPVQRNYGFQILTKEDAFTLSAMTSGIRRNWIQAIMKNVQPTVAPDVTRKNVSLKLSVLKPSSLPDEKAKARATMEICPQLAVELRQSPESPAADGEEPSGNSTSSEQRRTRVRERRREGRSKTFDWADFRHGQEEPPERGGPPERAMDVSSASSPNSTPASSPISSVSSATSSANASVRDPGTEEDLELGRARRREERRRRFQTTPISASVPAASTVDNEATGPPEPDAGKMEVNRSVAISEPPGESGGEQGKPPNVQVEIEQRWYQVETTPLREEKQVPIATIQSSNPATERLPPQELAALLDKELEQTQKELSKLQEQNSLLQEQLQDARGREHSARDGYVLQSASTSSSPHTGNWQRLHKLNQELQTELETQRRKQDLTHQQVQALKKNYSQAKDVIRHHESEIQALQTKLNNAMAEILISEQAVAKMRSELKMEQEFFRDHKEEWEHNELTLRAQLKDSEDRLKDVEAHLLERSQALRDLERQQALQRDHLKEVQKLQERLSDVTCRLIATEEAQALKEERLQKNMHILQESQEKERQSLLRRLAEAEGKGQELEDRLQEAEQQVEALLREKQTSGIESSEVVHQLEEQLAIKSSAIEKLTESIRQLEEVKDQLTCRCQELLNQIAEADNEVSKLQSRLKTEETDYYNLEHSYEKVSEEFQKINRVLREKEEEIREAKEIYERLVEKKEQDLNEAMIKMAALGSSLEETEIKLQAKEQLICRIGQGSIELCTAEKDLQAKLVLAEDRIAELEQHLNDLQIGYSDLQMEHCKLQDDCDVLESISKLEDSSTAAAVDTPLTVADVRAKVKTSIDAGGLLAKTQRIRFSSIHCQKYVHSDGGEKLWASSTSSDISQDFSVSEEGMSSETPYQHVTSDSSEPEQFMSIIHALETKLCTTEEKLKEITLKLEEQQRQQLESMMEQHSQWTITEVELQEQLNMSLSKVDQLTAQLQEEMDKRHTFAQETDVHIRSLNAKYEKALACVESSRVKVQAILRCGEEDSSERQLHTLSEVENELINASVYIREGENTLGDQQLDIQGSQNQEMNENKVSEKDSIQLLAKTLDFEALVLNKMAFSIQNPNLDLLQSLNEIHQETEKLKMGDEGYVAIVYADTLAKKLMLESEFWAEVEKLETQYKVSEDSRQGVTDLIVDNTVGDAGIKVIDNACVKAELAFSVQSLKQFYEEKFQKLKKDLLDAHTNLQQRELALKEIMNVSTRPDFDKAIQDVCEEFDPSEMTLADISPPELAPYAEQIKMEVAHDLAEEIVNRHLQGNVPSCSIEFVESPHVARDTLAAELKWQAKILQRLSQEIEITFEAESSNIHPRLVNISQVNYSNSSDVNSSSLCLREAMIQAQIAYVACKLRAVHKRDIKLCREACQSMDVLCKEHSQNVGAIRERYEASLQAERQSFTETVFSLQGENEALKAELSHRITELSQQQDHLVQMEEHFRQEIQDLRASYELELKQVEQARASTELALMENTADSQCKLQAVFMDIENMENQHEKHMRKLEDEFHEKIQNLQQIHENEMQRLNSHYMQTIQALQDALESTKASQPEDVPLPEVATQATDQPLPMEQGTSEISKAELDCMMVLRERIQELEIQMNTMKDELENKHLEGDVSSLKGKYQKDFESLKATCERGFAAMEETHQKVIEDIQRQHQREISKLLEERERLLAEETAATIAAIEAMKNAHREEMEKTQRSQLSGMGSDIDELRRQYEEELQSIHRELEVLSEQYSQKCLENAHLAQALEAERQALRQCQRENQELNAHNQELNNRLTTEITRMRSCFSGEVAGSPLVQGKDLYELEVLLRVKESEIQYLKQEIHSLKDELQSALRDKKYATDKYKDIYTELSIVKAKADCDISKLKEQLILATEALGERSADGTPAVPGYDIMKSKSNPDFLKKERSTLSRQIRGVRSKSLKEGLTVQERMKLFEAKGSGKI